MKLVLIEWVDAQSVHNWIDMKALKENAMNACRTVGWLVVDEKDRKTVASTVCYDSDGEVQSCTGDICIPAGTITKMTVLRKSL